MKIITTVNGKIALTITPETELEKQILSELFKGEVTCILQEKLQIHNNALLDSVTISPKGVNSSEVK